MSTPRDLVALYTELAARVTEQTNLDGALGAVTAIAVESIPGASYGSITRVREHGFQTLGPTHPDATINDRKQYELGSGPCIDAAVDDAAMLLVPDLANDLRWPRFGPAAAGAASMLSTRMVFDDDSGVRASLNLYSRQLDAFDEAAETIAMVMAAIGALAVTGVVRREHAVNLERALGNSRVIGMAMGVLMATQPATEDEAFTLLRVASQDRNRKLFEIARDVVDTGVLAGPESTPG